VYKSRSLNYGRTQMNPIHAIRCYYIRSILILSFHLRLCFTSSVFPSGIQNKNVVCITHISHACYMQLPSHHPAYGHFDNTGKECEVSRSVMYNSLRPPVISSPLYLNALFSITTANTVKLYSSRGATYRI
jgi:hypothetical protein